MTRLRIAVLGYIIRGPLGGVAWEKLNFTIGLARLGHDVRFLEDSDDYPSCYDPVRGVVDEDPSYGLRFASAVFDRVGMPDCWAYHDAHKAKWHGPAADSILDWLAGADVLLNVSGVNPIRPWLLRVPVRAFIDTDPAFIQVRHLTRPDARALAAAHTHFFTIGENIPAGRSAVPDDGFAWQATRQPVVLDAWPLLPAPRDGKLTTVMQWDSYPACEYAGMRFGMKSESFGPYFDLPTRCGPRFELAIGSPNAPRDRLREHGWLLRDPLEVTRDPWTYQDYLQSSAGEFGIAKHGYVSGRTGWFSERSACYLASGRPVLVQDTGFTDWLSADGGVIPFRNVEEAEAGVRDLSERYTFHVARAREIAAEYFDATKVLSRLLADL